MTGLLLASAKCW